MHASYKYILSDIGTNESGETPFLPTDDGSGDKHRSGDTVEDDDDCDDAHLVHAIMEPEADTTPDSRQQDVCLPQRLFLPKE
jgi:hypothetical protein